jgi:hypothetical protein
MRQTGPRAFIGDPGQRRSVRFGGSIRRVREPAKTAGDNAIAYIRSREAQSDIGFPVDQVEISRIGDEL